MTDEPIRTKPGRLRLFKIEGDRQTQYCDSQRQARKIRDRLVDDGVDVAIRRGPDHRKGETFYQPTGDIDVK